MDRNIILNLLKKGEKTSKKISKEIDLSLIKTRTFLLRLMEEGKITRKQRDKQWYWSLTEATEEKIKLEKYRQESN